MRFNHPMKRSHIDLDTIADWHNLAVAFHRAAQVVGWVEQSVAPRNPSFSHDPTDDGFRYGFAKFSARHYLDFLSRKFC